jgi:hypothetical protein
MGIREMTPRAASAVIFAIKTDELNMNEELKTIGEVAKASGKLIEASCALGGFLARVTGGPIKQAMSIVEDQLKYYRWERQNRLIDRATKFMAERGLTQPTRYIPLQLAIPLLQSGSLEENDQLQDRWAALLVNAADADSNTEVRRAFISILEDLTSLDALLLDKIYSTDQLETIEEQVWTTFLPSHTTATQPNQEDLNPAHDVGISLGNLARLGLVTTAIAWGGFQQLSCINRTALGQEFMKSITGNKNSSSI